MEAAGQVVFLGALFVMLGCALFCAVTDFRKLKIPNIYSVIIIISFIVAILAQPDFFSVWWHHVLSGLIMLVVTFIMFAFGLIGGGDSKLAAALALWVAPAGIPAFLFYMTLTGGILGVFSILIKRYKPFKSPAKQSWINVLQSGGNAVPYGIAIFFGVVMGLFLSGQLSLVVS